MIVAVDFDGVLCENQYPRIGPAHQDLLDLLCRYRQSYTLILWTCRTGKALNDAIWWCGEHNLQFDYVNENAKEVLDRFGGTESRKIYADLYIDSHTGCHIDLGQIENILD